MPPLTTASISLELLQDCLGTLEQLATGITNIGVDATEDPTQAPRVWVLLKQYSSRFLVQRSSLCFVLR